MSGSRAALGVLAVAGLVFGLAALALVLTGDHDEITGPFVVLALTLGWSFIGTGLYAMWRRPEQPIGRLMTLVGFLWFLGALPESDSAFVHTLGLALGGLWVGPLVHLLVAFPSGRVNPGLERWLVRLGVRHRPAATPGACCSPPSRSRTARAARRTSCWCRRATAVFEAGGLPARRGERRDAHRASCVVLVRRWRHSGPVQRRALAPVLWTGGGIALVGVAGVIPQALGADGVDGGRWSSR